MVKALSLLFVLVLTCGVVWAQNSNSSTTTERPRSTNTNRSKPAAQSPTATPKPAASPAKAAPKKPATTAPDAAGSDGVLAAFNSLLDGIRHANVNEVTGIYWNNPRLNLFNYNGSVTKGWEQVRKNRESSYPEIKDVKLDVRDVSVTMLGPTGAVVTCQWRQSQTYKGAPETASGRMTLVFKRIGTAWKAIHLHSSPDTPNPASIPPSEQQSPAPAPSPSPTP
ncbi:MAG TPA: nuclear transport factor 2 family protein [Pyrinomonadaceae bacterium]|jgi:ketosteroid isomerase-like protein|nr:nuclear transport factor 2 family protein [Pyrinomonadaceae bacterium]